MRNTLDTGRCLREESVLDFVSGQLPPDRLDWLNRHLDHCVGCLDLLAWAARQGSSVDAPEIAACDVGHPVTNFQPGERVGERFVVERFLAKGGMGEVYAAWDTRRERRVALKTVRACTSDSRSARRRLREEARLARRIRHDNVYRVHGCGLHEGPTAEVELPLLVMDYLPGDNLAQRLAKRPLSPSELEALSAQVLRGLRAIHGSDVLHLDVKSANVVLRERDDGGLDAVIVDFGLSREWGKPSLGRKQIAGSFPYMAPERLLGMPDCPKHDVFSFGVVLFEMLTGKLPYGSCPTGSCVSTAKRRLAEAVSLPRRIPATVPERFRRVLLGCLMPIERRYESADAVLQALAS